MSKGLEALERIGKRKYKTTAANITGFETVSISVKQDNRKDYNIIEKELKRLEELEKAFDSLSKEDEKAKKLLSLEIEKNRALNEILALYDKWLGNEMSDFEFFTLLSEVKDKYGLSKEVSNHGN